MKTSFLHRAVNGVYGDPCVYVRLAGQARALMFDLGDIGAVTQGEAHRVRDVFITHMHMDHFMGFDVLLRYLLGQDAVLRLYGPEGLTDCVAGRLGGYTWNLIREYPVGMEVVEIVGNEMRRTGFFARRGFQRETMGAVGFAGEVLREEGFWVRAMHVDHGIPGLAYMLGEDAHINIDKAALVREGRGPGSWLGELKRAIRAGRGRDTMLQVDGGGAERLHDLMRFVIVTEGERIGYVTDVAPTEANLTGLRGFLRGVRVLYGEAYYLDEDSDLARRRNHLTGGAMGRLAQEAGASRLIAIHVSPKYKGAEHTPVDEAMEAFGGGGRRVNPSERGHASV